METSLHSDKGLILMHLRMLQMVTEALNQQMLSRKNHAAYAEGLTSHVQNLLWFASLSISELQTGKGNIIDYIRRRHASAAHLSESGVAGADESVYYHEGKLDSLRSDTIEELGSQMGDDIELDMLKGKPSRSSSVSSSSHRHHESTVKVSYGSKANTFYKRSADFKANDRKERRTHKRNRNREKDKERERDLEILLILPFPKFES
eukprot:jgi/Bigna1/76473/fgenesh1_pg.41_\